SDRMHDLGQERSHQLALHALDLTARLLAALLPRLTVVDSLESLQVCWDAGDVPVLAPRRFLDQDDHSPDALPHTWDSTSDSIAARVARRIEASALILLKSAPLPPGTDRERAAALALVDAVFPKAAHGLGRIAYVCLRDASTGPGGAWI